MGRCQLDRYPSHPGYSCRRYHPSVVALQIYLDLTPADLTRLRADHHTARANALRAAWLWVWKTPEDPTALQTFRQLLTDYRAQ
jgi:hypothetical protein